GNQWYYIMPTGQLYLWTGNINSGTLVAALDVTYWSDPSLLCNGPNLGPTSFLNLDSATGVLGFTSELRGLTGSVIVQATVTDSLSQSAATYFKLTVTNLPPTLSVPDYTFSLAGGAPTGQLTASDGDASGLT